MPELQRCIYLSSRNAPVTNEIVDDIVRQARQCNARDAVTGALIGGDDFFFQVIEGPDRELAGLMDRIFSDTRHEIEIYQVIECKERAFPNWDMAYATLDRSTIAEMFLVEPDTVEGSDEERVRALDAILVDAMKNIVGNA